MAKRIHFEDDIFLANLMIRLVRDATRLEINTALFENWILDTLNSISEILEGISESLLDNRQILEHEEQLSNLVEAWSRQLALLGAIELGTDTLSAALQPARERITILKSNARARHTELALHEGNRQNNEDDPSLVSMSELNHLLGPDNV